MWVQLFLLILGQLFSQVSKMKRIAISLSLLILSSEAVFAWDNDQFSGVTPAYSDLEIEDLMNLSITSVSKHQEKISRAAASIYVLTAHDLKESGVVSLPEALRLVPGMEVSQINGAQYEVSTRGARDLFANKLLVLIDGRSIYTPLFAGVHWEMQQFPIESIDRIEVIRGPGGALWGSNAVNGVINIVTKSAAQMQGGQLTGNLGDKQRFGTLSYGSALNDSGYQRAYYHQSRDDLSVDQSSRRDFHRVDWRLDQAFDKNVKMTVDADAFSGAYNYDTIHAQSISPYIVKYNSQVDMRGGFVNSVLQGQSTASHEWQVQLYLEQYERDYELTLHERQRISDLSGQLRFNIGQNQSITWGAGLRGNWDDFEDSLTIQFSQEDEYNLIQQAFVQDQISLLNDRGQLTLGTKVEHHRFDGTETLPTARFSYALGEAETLWAAVSKAVQVQSRANRSLTYLVDYKGVNEDTGLPVMIGLRPGQNIVSEKLTAYEAGFRARLAEQLTFDIDTYVHRYRDFRVSAPVAAEATSFDGFNYIIAGPVPGGSAKAESNGVDAVVQWRPRPSDRWLFGYSYLDFNIKDLSGTNPQAELQGRAEPQHMWTLQQNHKFNEKWSMFTHIRYVAKLPYSPPLHPSVQEYWATDLSVRYAIEKDLSLGLIGRNLLDPKHYETTLVFGQSDASEIARSMALELDWRF